MASTVCFTAAPSSLSFITAASPSLLPSLFSQSCFCEKDRKRDIKRTQACVRRSALMALHTAECVLALIQYEHAVSLGRMKTARCFREEVRCAPLSASFGRGFCLEGSLEYFVGPECFSIPPEAAFLSACVWAIVSLCVCVLWACGIQLLRTTNEQLPYQSRLSRLCELY